VTVAGNDENIMQGSCGGGGGNRVGERLQHLLRQI
jgi:hypothetical protein